MQTGEIDDRLISARSLGFALTVHVVFFAAIWIAGCVMDRPADVVIPIDMTIVPPESEEPPPPEETKPKPKPKEPDPPKATEKLDAVVKIPPKKPKPPEKKAEEKKPEEKKPDPPKPKRNAVKPPDPKNLKHGPKPAPVKPPAPRVVNPKSKPLSADEIAKALAMGARFGDTNSLPESEEERCFGVIGAAIFHEWDRESFTWYAGLKNILVTISLGPGGQIKSWSVVRGSGSAEVDATVKRAMARVKTIRGLSAGFISKYPTVEIELKPKSAR